MILDPSPNVGLLASETELWSSLDKALLALAEEQTVRQIDRMTGLALARRATGELPLAAAAGAFLSHMRAAGYVCVRIGRLPQYPLWQRLSVALDCGSRRLLAATGVLGEAGDATSKPLVMDQGRLYFHRGWRQEVEVAELLLGRAARPPAATAARSGTRPQLSAQQQEAVDAALGRALCVISGGPGSGKTTVAGAIVRAAIDDLGCRAGEIALAAPTGKAAARLAVSVNGALQQRPEFVPLEARTLHRLLGWNRERASFYFGPERSLPLAMLIVDEVSMIDLDLMHALLVALREDCRLVLLGDRDQLASVQPGNVLADICAPPGNSGAGHGLEGCIVRLRRSYRFAAESGIGALAAAVNRGDARGAIEILNGGDPQLGFSRVSDWDFPFSKDFLAAFSDPNPLSALSGLDHFRVLSAHRRGPFGSEVINRRIMSRLRVQGVLPPARPGEHFENELFVVVGNHYDIGLYNGDQGLFKHTADGLKAFVGRDAQSERRISPRRLPETEPAYCLTVHRSQGSEFERVLVILPDQSSPLLTRELLYTAITRARTRVDIWGTEAALKTAIESPSERGSGLAERLWGAPRPGVPARASRGSAPRQGELF